jgi:transposase
MITALQRAKSASAGKRATQTRQSVSPPAVRKKLPRTIHTEIIQAYESGATTRQLAASYGVSKTNIKDLLHRNGVDMRNRPLTANQIQEAIDLHAGGLSTYKIAERFGVVQSTVWRALRRSERTSA